MIGKFIEEYAKRLAFRPEHIRVESHENGGCIEIVLFCSKEDVGKLIGRNGRMIQAFRSLLSGCKVKNGMTYKISIKSL